jgi:hypothetical protein
MADFSIVLAVMTAVQKAINLWKQYRNMPRLKAITTVIILRPAYFSSQGVYHIGARRSRTGCAPVSIDTLLETEIYRQHLVEGSLEKTKHTSNYRKPFGDSQPRAADSCCN